MTETHSTSSKLVNPLFIPLIAALEVAMNQLFALDADTFDQLSRFKGKIIAFELTDIGQNLYFFADQQGMHIMSYYEGEADTWISGTLIAFSRMALSDEANKTRAVFNGDIKISGDIALGQHFQSLFKRLDIDWEEHLSHITGDVIAHSIGNIARGLLSWGKNTATTLGLDAGEYIQYETQDVASGPEINEFIESVDSLRSQIDRAEARVNRIQTLLSNQSLEKN